VHDIAAGADGFRLPQLRSIPAADDCGSCVSAGFGSTTVKIFCVGYLLVLAYDL